MVNFFKLEVYEVKFGLMAALLIWAFWFVFD